MLGNSELSACMYNCMMRFATMHSLTLCVRAAHERHLVWDFLGEDAFAALTMHERVENLKNLRGSPFLSNTLVLPFLPSKCFFTHENFAGPVPSMFAPGTHAGGMPGGILVCLLISSHANPHDAATKYSGIQMIFTSV